MANNETKIQPVDPGKPGRAVVMQAVSALRSGALVILPTETVYGVAGLPGTEARIYAAKERDRGKPIPLMASGVEAVEGHGAVLSSKARRLACREWPGPLTLVLSCGGRAEGFRVPDHAVAMAVLKGAGGLLRVTSANLSGEPSAKTVEAAMAALGGHVALALDAGPSPLGVESTVVDATGDELKILRQGALSKEAIMAKPQVLFVCTGNTCRSPMAEYLLRKWLGPDSGWDVASAGVSAFDGERASAGAVRAMEEEKLDISGHRSQYLTQAHIDGSDLIVVMTAAHQQAVLQRFPRAADRVVLLNKFSHRRPGEDVPDPFGMRADVYRTIRDEIEAAMPDLVLHVHGLYK